MKNDKQWINTATIANENIVSASDFNLNLIYFYHSSSVKIYVNKIFKNNRLNLMNKRTRVKSKSISAIDHLNADLFYNLRTLQKVLNDTEYTRKAQKIYKMIFREKQIDH